MNIVKTLWNYRGFIFGSVKREFQGKYRNSLLGAAWLIINPLAMIFVYTVIFSQLMHSKLPGVEGGFGYSVYLCAGSLAWGLFSEIVGRCQNVFLDNANLLKKVNFPRITLPVILILNAGINFTIIFTLFLLFLLFAGLWPGWAIVAVVPLLLIQLLLGVGLGVILGVLNVFFRDVGNFFGIFLQFWFWFTPIVYPSSILPEQVKSIMLINPMYSLVSAYQGVFTNNQWPNWVSLFYPSLLALMLCLFSLRLFRLHAAEMVDEL